MLKAFGTLLCLLGGFGLLGGGDLISSALAFVAGAVMYTIGHFTKEEE